MINKFKI